MAEARWQVRVSEQRRVVVGLHIQVSGAEEETQRAPHPAGCPRGGISSLGCSRLENYLWLQPEEHCSCSLPPGSVTKTTSDPPSRHSRLDRSRPVGNHTGSWLRPGSGEDC